MRILIADTETTGLGSDAEIAELAFFEIDPDLTVVREFSSLINPQGLICPAASAASGITNRLVESAPRLEEVLATFEKGYFDDVFVICHNLIFDKRFLAPIWNIAGELCTLRAARQLWPDAPNHKLQTLRYYKDLDIDSTAHRALGDVEVTLKLLDLMLRETGKTLLDLAHDVMAPKKINTMPFGKYKGTPLKDLPGGYFKWLLGLDNLETDLRTSLLEL